MNVNIVTGSAVVALLLLVSLWLFGWERPPMESVQVGYRGTGMALVTNPRMLEEKVSANVPPPAVAPSAASGVTAGEVYQNVQVLGDLDVGQFNRLMVAITQWVSPEQGCAYCHGEQGLAQDDMYTKVVARRMLQMTQDINGAWSDHVAETGVTCYTCHRGKPVPEGIWFTDPGTARSPRQAANRAQAEFSGAGGSHGVVALRPVYAISAGR